MRGRINGEVRERLRQLLLQRTKTFGLTPAAIEQLLGTAVLERWSAGEEIATADAEGDRLGFVVVGAAKVVRETPRGKPVSVCFVAPGHPLPTVWPGDAGVGRRQVRVVAHDPMGTIVASWAPRSLLEALATLPPAHALQVIAATWQAAAEVLGQKCDLLGLCLRDRVLAVLVTLSRDFGRPHPDGLRIELRLTHQDLAGAAVGSRANVTRALEELREGALVTVDEHRLVVTHRGLVGLRDAGPAGSGWTGLAAAAAH
jgi:CRP/FNR family transcriptional regulator